MILEGTRIGDPLRVGRPGEIVARTGEAAKRILYIYQGNVFPEMNITWGTYPNNLGHTDFPGCFRCHDGNHNAKGGASITNDCSACHNLLTTDDPSPKLLSDLGMR